MKVLITGAAGRVGRVLTRELGGDHELVLGDVRPLDDARFLRLDVTDVAQVRETVARCDAVIYLAIADMPSLGGDSLEYANAALQVHVGGLYNVLRAAADAGGKRVLYASTLSALAGYPKEEWITSEHRPLGGGIYGVTKGFGEELCRLFHQERKLPVVILRLGSFYMVEAHRGQAPRANPYWGHELDVARAFGAALAAEGPPFAVIHVVGDNPGRRWDLEAGERLFGWQPRYTFGDDGVPRLVGEEGTEGRGATEGTD